jgi:hypothetical protein
MSGASPYRLNREHMFALLPYPLLYPTTGTPFCGMVRRPGPILLGVRGVGF